MNLAFRCQCGKVEGHVSEFESSKGPRMICLCDDCQAYAYYLGQADTVLDRNGGSDIVAVRPCHFKLDKGLDEIRCLRLSEQGLLRFYTACCQTPIGNQMNRGFLPYIGTFVSIFKNAAGQTDIEGLLGPMRGRLKSEFGIPPLPEGKDLGLLDILPILSYLISGLWKGEYKPSPFFREGKLAIDTHILSPHERESLQKHVGPQPGKA